MIDLEGRTAYLSDNKVTFSNSLSLDNIRLNDVYKDYLNKIVNTTSAGDVLLRLNFLDRTAELTPADSTIISFFDQEGREDDVIDMLKLDGEVYIHTVGGVSRIIGDLLANFKVAEVARVPITTNIINDSTVIIGANDDTFYAMTFLQEYQGFTAHNINKKLLSLKSITGLVNFLKVHRLIVGVREGSNVLYILSQDTNRAFKGFSKFFLPKRVQHYPNTCLLYTSPSPRD